MIAIFDLMAAKDWEQKEICTKGSEISPSPSLNAASISKSNMTGWLNDRKLLNVHSPYWDACIAG